MQLYSSDLEKEEYFIGTFKDDMRHGLGKNVYIDGGEWVSEYIDDNRNGHGWETFDGKDVWVGKWKDNKPVKKGWFG